MSQIKFKINDVKNINGSQYRTIIYIPSKGDILVEVPKTNKVYSIEPHRMCEYISLSTPNTGWIKLYDNSIFQIFDRGVEHIFKISNTIRPMISIKLNCTANERIRLNRIQNENFIFNNEDRILTFRSVFLPLICKTRSNSLNTNNKVYVKKFLMVYNNKLYALPYGNTYISGDVCFGHVQNMFDTVTKEQILTMLIGSQFNQDVSFNFYNISNSKELLLTPQIKEFIHCNETIHPYDMLYYISQTDAYEIEYDKILYESSYNKECSYTEWDTLVNAN